jgi:nitrate/nitrite transport system permease protein
MINADQLNIQGAVQADLSEAVAKTTLEATDRPGIKFLVDWVVNRPGLKQILTQLMLVVASFTLLLLAWALIATISPDLPGPSATLPELWKLISNPFYDNGPNDKGIGIQVMMSLQRVFSGWIVGSLFAIPIGILMGSSKTIMGLLNPIIQILRPVSPLAWYPIGLAVYKNAGNAVIFAIIITSLWPTLLNTMIGAASVPNDYRNVSRVFNFSRWKYLTKVLIPYTLPYTLTGLRLSMGIAWMVIVAGEMLAGSTGIGFFVWDSWNALSLERVICAILIIGIIGLTLDRTLDWFTARVRYDH